MAGEDVEQGEREVGKKALLLPGLVCCGCVGIGLFIFLIIVFAGITRVGPEDQLVYTHHLGKETKDGPAVIVVWPHQKIEWRKATRLGPREFAVVKNRRSGIVRHEDGPTLLFIGPYDDILETKSKIILQKLEYMRLIDNLSGYERIVTGPQTLTPNPMEEGPDGVEQAKIIGADQTLLVLNRVTGAKKMVMSTGSWIPEAYERIVEMRSGVLLGPQQYAVVKNHLTGSSWNEIGPMLLKLDAYESLVEIRSKLVLRKEQYIRLFNRVNGTDRIMEGPMTFSPEPNENSTHGIQDKVVLKKDEYIRLLDNQDGTERIVVGPITLVPGKNEESEDGKQASVYVDSQVAVLVRDKSSGEKKLVSAQGVFTPGAYEEILEVRQKVRVLPNEAVVVRDGDGRVTSYRGSESGGTAFFLQPFSSIVEMSWSDFTEPPPRNSDGLPQEHAPTKAVVRTIDLRSRKMFFAYDVRTQDNVRLMLEGTIFWQIQDVDKMVNMTADPEGDVWHHARSALIQAVSQSSLNQFMVGFNTITRSAFDLQASDGFYVDRGVEVQSMEMTGYDCTDKKTSEILQSIIQETTNRINRLQAQTSDNEVAVAALDADIQLEYKRTELIAAQANNTEMQARMSGQAEGSKLSMHAKTFFDDLNDTIPNLDSRYELYTLHQTLTSRNEVTANLASGHAHLFLTPEHLDLRLGDGAMSPSWNTNTSRRQRRLKTRRLDSHGRTPWWRGMDMGDNDIESDL